MSTQHTAHGTHTQKTTFTTCTQKQTKTTQNRSQDENVKHTHLRADNTSTLRTPRQQRRKHLTDGQQRKGDGQGLSNDADLTKAPKQPKGAKRRRNWSEAAAKAIDITTNKTEPIRSEQRRSTVAGTTTHSKRRKRAFGFLRESQQKQA